MREVASHECRRWRQRGRSTSARRAQVSTGWSVGEVGLEPTRLIGT
ncbi:hypothetical protein trd_1554 [Thermomicrobium roseum DSM 5159]|uniref:Uncharacterized protein n=1 Tax=Thermomicrobium roseum (strain ATCC 27502 / DSM 5159 / P-2) TaxID=309801 RepID=B9L062_THERP|nr:hypothetical protein trd_1554 [Thermomicrobium roseum DSM 5159]